MDKLRLPPDWENSLKLYTVSASIGELEQDSEIFVRARQAANTRTAAVPPIGENGKPRMLKITAWIAHEGKPNRNRDAFVAEDLEAAVEGELFGPPYFGMIDYNHDFNAYGAWFHAKYAFDPVAEQWGILAEGAIFAWRYPDLSDKLLAAMQRDGFIPVSMACIPMRVEEAEDENGMPYTVLREPVFFTSSVLDVDPADPNARGLATEDPEAASEERERALMLASIPTSLSVSGQTVWWANEAPIYTEENSDQEESMDIEKLVATIKAAVGEVADEHRDTLLDLVEKVAHLPKVEAELAAAKEEKEALTERIAALEADLETANLGLDEAKARLEELTEEHAALAAFKAEIEAEREEAARLELREARLAELNETARARLDTRPEEIREKIIARIVEADEDEFELIKETLNLARTDERVSYKDRSEREGPLTGVDVSEGGSFAIYKYVK